MYKYQENNGTIFYSKFNEQVINTDNNNEKVAFLREKGESKMYEEIIVQNGVDTVTKAFNYAVQKYGNKDCLGTRQILGKIQTFCNLIITMF